MTPLDIWTVYRHPSDYPDKYVARRSEITKDITHTNEMFVGDSLEEIRKLLPAGLVHLDPLPGDDPVIVEVWI